VKPLGHDGYPVGRQEETVMRRAAERELGALQERVERWRRDGGGRGARIPEELWDAAVAVAREEGVYATSRALRFNYYSLKDRMSAVDLERRTEETRVPAAFIELPRGSLGGGGRAVVELVGRGGGLRIEVTGASPVDVVALAQAFWSRAS
jgi:hypothetical protein